MDRKEWLLMALAMAQDRGLSPVQLQKSLFLFAKYMPEAVGKKFYRFTAYDYGPFDKAIYSDAEALAGEGLAIIERGADRPWFRQYRIAPSGMEYTRQLEKSLEEKVLSCLRGIVKWCCDRSFQEIVRAIYREFPEYRKNSVFQG